MTQLDISAWREVNNSFRRPLIYHLGTDCGFFVELNFMINAMLFCLKHRLRFMLYSDDANFGTGIGWTEYFVPFCEEVHEPFHRRYNVHRPPSWWRILKNTVRRKTPTFIVWKLKSSVRSLVGHWLAYWSYGEYVRLSQDVAPDPARHYDIPSLGISCNYYEAYALLARMIWQPQPEVLCHIADTKRRLALPTHYSGVQIRGGDKATEAQLISGRQIIQALHPEDGDSIFVLTDDYSQLEDIREHFPQLRFLSLCQQSEHGYYHSTFSASDPIEKKAAIVRLLISADLLLHAHKFVGSITTGPSIFLLKLRSHEPSVQTVDCPKEDLQDILFLPGDQRAAFSAKHIVNK